MTALAPVTERPVLTFEEESHTYAVGGVVKPSVTQVLADAGLCDYSFCDEYAMWRGSAVHKAIHMELTTGVDWSTVPESFQPYVSAAKQMIADLGGEVVESERRVFSVTRNYAGTLDLILRVGGQLWKIDYKTGPARPWTGLQLAGYAAAYFEETGLLIARRYAAHLKPSGDYQLALYADRTDRDRFLAALTVANLRREYGLLKGESN
jgi:hypothetical protein